MSIRCFRISVSYIIAKYGGKEENHFCGRCQIGIVELKRSFSCEMDAVFYKMYV